MGVPLAAVTLATEAVLQLLPDKSCLRYLVAGYAPLFGLALAACLHGSLGTATTVFTAHLIGLDNAMAKSVVHGLSREEQLKTAMSIAVIVCTMLGGVLVSRPQGMAC